MVTITQIQYGYVVSKKVWLYIIIKYTEKNKNAMAGVWIAFKEKRILKSVKITLSKKAKNKTSKPQLLRFSLVDNFFQLRYHNIILDQVYRQKFICELRTLYDI